MDNYLVSTGPSTKFRGDLNNTGRSEYAGPLSGSAATWSYSLSTVSDDVVCSQSSPAIDSNGTIYTSSNDYLLYAIQSNGSLKWKFKTNSWIKSSPVVVSVSGSQEKRVLVGSSDGYFYSVDADTGSKLWSFKTKGAIISSPSVDGNGTIYFGSEDKSLYALTSEGTFRWKFGTGGLIYSSPAINTATDTIYIGSADNYLYAISTDGTKKWSYQTTGAIEIGSPAIGGDGSVYIGSNDYKLYAVSSSGTLLWTYLTGGAVYSSPALASDGSLYFGSADNYIYSVSSAGTLRWKYKTGGIVLSSPSVSANETIYVGSGDGYVYSLSKDGALYWQFKSTASKVDSTPTISFGRSLIVNSCGTVLYKLHGSSSAFTPTASPTVAPTHQPANSWYSSSGSNDSVSKEATAIGVGVGVGGGMLALFILAAVVYFRFKGNQRRQREPAAREVVRSSQSSVASDNNLLKEDCQGGDIEINELRDPLVMESSTDRGTINDLRLQGLNRL